MRFARLRTGKRWQRGCELSPDAYLQVYLRAYCLNAIQYQSDYLIVPDIRGESLPSSSILPDLPLSSRQSSLCIGCTVCVHTVHTCGCGASGIAALQLEQSAVVPSAFTLPLNASIEFLAFFLADNYCTISYQIVALEGLLKPASSMPTGMKFGLREADRCPLLAAVRVDFVLGELVLRCILTMQRHDASRRFNQLALVVLVCIMPIALVAIARRTC